MKKAFALLLALCLLACTLPMAVLADSTEPAVTEPVAAPIETQVKCYNGTAPDFTLTVKSGVPTYVVADANKEIIRWTDKQNAPTDNFVKFELTAGEPAVLKATFQNLVVDQTAAGGYTNHGMEFMKAAFAYNVEIELVGENSMTHGISSCIKCSNTGSATIYGEGSIHLAMTGQASAPLWANCGDLLIRDTTMSFDIKPGINSTHHAIASAKGNVTFERAKITADTEGGCLVWMGVSDTRNCRTTLDTDTSRMITVKDCDITFKTYTGAVFASAAPAVISGTTMTVTKGSSSGRNMFVPAPTFEGDYTAMAGLAKNANDPSKLKAYNANKIGSYTYLSLVPYVVETEPTTVATEPTTVPTEPEVTIPKVTEPKVTEATTPATTEATTPATTEATAPVTDDVTDNAPMNPLVIVLIVTIVLIVAAIAVIVVVLYLRKKNGI